MSGHTTIRAGHDTWAGSGEPTRTHAGATQLQIGDNAYAYLWFHNPAPRGATVLDAILRFYTAQTGWPQTTVDVHRIVPPGGAAPNWNLKFAHLNWNNRPPAGDAVVSHTHTSPGGADLWEINIAALYQILANGAPNYGIRLSTGANTRRHLWSLNANTHRPSLEVRWSDAPETPTNLTPSGGQVIGTSHPVLQFQYRDHGAGAALHAVQVQIDDVGDWPGGQVNWDSGTVHTNEPELDLSRTDLPHTYGGLAQGVNRYWRVRAQDEAELWSRWSARGAQVGARMIWHPKGTLTIDSPGDDGFVDDFTPMIAWTFTPPAGRAQSGFQLVLVHPDDPSEVIWTVRRSGTADSFTIPSGVLRHWGTHWRLIVRVWDDYDRVSIPNSASFVSASRDFTLRDHPGVTPPTQLTGTVDPDGKPFMRLTWRRDDAPHAWWIFRGEEHVASMPGVDALIGPEQYRWVDRECRPNSVHTWTVKARVHGQTSRNNPSWTGRVNTFHAWLRDPDNEQRLVAILDPDVSFEEPDTSATYEPVNVAHVIRVTQRHRGMQGTVAGRIIGYELPGGRGWTLDEMRDNFLYMKAHPGRDYRLSTGNRTWRVLLGDMITSPMRIPGSAAETVSFSFWSLDGPERPT